MLTAGLDAGGHRDVGLRPILAAYRTDPQTEGLARESRVILK